MNYKEDTFIEESREVLTVRSVNGDKVQLDKVVFSIEGKDIHQVVTIRREIFITAFIFDIKENDKIFLIKGTVLDDSNERVEIAAIKEYSEAENICRNQN